MAGSEGVCPAGGFQAGLQLSLTLWLLLHRVLDPSLLLGVAWHRGRYGNLTPSIPLISAASSLATLILTATRLNLPLPYRAYCQTSFRRRYGQQAVQVCQVCRWSDGQV